MLKPPRPEVILRQLMKGASASFCMYSRTTAPASVAVLSSLFEMEDPASAMEFGTVWANPCEDINPCTHVHNYTHSYPYAPRAMSSTPFPSKSPKWQSADPR